MARAREQKMTKKTKILISGVVAVSLVGLGTFLWFKSQPSQAGQNKESNYQTIKVTEGTISSSTLLSGTVKSESEQYVYYDPARGNGASVVVKVGDKVARGQQLVQYNATAAQAAYDTAVRNLNKAARQINSFRTYGSVATPTEGASAAGQVTQSYNQQLQDLNDAYADAQSEVNKAKEALNQTLVLSDVEGTVVEVNNDIDPSSKNSQTLVHVASEGKLQVKGTLTEFDLANIKKDQDVKIKSKVYSDQEWQGKMAYISNYPTVQAAASPQPEGENTNSQASNYEYKADITSPIKNLKQGFAVTVEVLNPNKRTLVPLKAVVKDKTKHYVWLYNASTKKAIKTEVQVGNADARQQEITSGLKVGQILIKNPDKKLTSGKTLEHIDDSASQPSTKHTKK
ncbi:efflux RND transporter periplasmic adaptor subunit [Streptococcus halichoeri]|uniref:efflux RND transporter periplasmic adaptor subunit n=1 Tax=Streptococcus halichoeri TaxID=254785 RepID=UPI0013569111|nr:efflux RND transporter periplasmic adaptor subunit [Streptococcus halichoeri]